VEADVTSGVENTEVLMASYVEDNTSQDKDWIFNSDSTVHVCSQKELFFVAKEEKLPRWWMTQLARSLALGQSRLQKEMRQCVFCRRSGMSWRHNTI